MLCINVDECVPKLNVELGDVASVRPIAIVHRNEIVLLSHPRFFVLKAFARHVGLGEHRVDGVNRVDEIGRDAVLRAVVINLGVSSVDVLLLVDEHVYVASGEQYFFRAFTG